MTVQLVRRTASTADELDFEFVERKGVGHPDTICDAIAERASQYYSRYCLAQFGRVAHHWFDKVMLIGGEAEFSFGRGEITKPYVVHFAGKAALGVGDTALPLEAILRSAAVDVLRTVLTGFDATRHLRVVISVVDYQGAGRGTSRYRPTRTEDLPTIDDPAAVSNDSNLVSSFAPLSRLERMVLLTERFVNGPEFKRRNPDSGWDVKVLGRRTNDRFHLLVNVPFLADGITSLEHYFQRKAEIGNEIEQHIVTVLGIRPELLLNATDRNGRAYLTVLGSVADTGDVGVVGRGNRTNGLITPMRAMSIEAAAGKNPLDHTGKLYAVLAQRLAEAVEARSGAPVDIHIFASKEAPLRDPDEVVVSGGPWDGTEPQIRDLVRAQLDSIGALTMDLIQGDRPLW